MNYLYIAIALFAYFVGYTAADKENTQYHYYYSTPMPDKIPNFREHKAIESRDVNQVART